MDSLVFLAQSKLVAFYRKSWTFHDVPFRGLMLNDAQTLLTQRAPVFEINSTAYWARWLGGLWSIDLFNFVWFIALVSRNTDFADCHQSHTMCKRMNWRTSEAKLRWSSVTIGLSTPLYPGLKVKLPQCSEKGASAGWWVILLKSIEHESLKASVQKNHGLIFLAQSNLIAFIWLLVLAGLNLLIQMESSPRMMGFCCLRPGVFQSLVPHLWYRHLQLRRATLRQRCCALCLGEMHFWYFLVFSCGVVEEKQPEIFQAEVGWQ